VSQSWSNGDGLPKNDATQMLTAKTSKRLQITQAQLQGFPMLLSTINKLLCSSTTARDF